MAFSELTSGASSRKILAVTSFRIATAADASGCLAIYAPFCREDSPVSFELEPPKLADMAGRITSTMAILPWLIGRRRRTAPYSAMPTPRHIWHGRHIAGRSMSRFIFIQMPRRQRLGSRLYKVLFAILREQGYCNAYAGITLPNEGSIALHCQLDFREVGGLVIERWVISAAPGMTLPG